MPIAMGTEGFVVAHKTRFAVFTEIAAGESQAERIAKKHRLVEPAVRMALKELVEHGVLVQRDGGYALTPEGERVAGEIRKGHMA